MTSNCLIKFYNDKFISKKINVKQINFENNNIVFKEINIFELKNILLYDYNINTKNHIFISKGIILDNKYILKKNDIILIVEDKEDIFNIQTNKFDIKDEKNNEDNEKYNEELKYLRLYPEITPLIYLIKDNPLYLETFLKDLKNKKSILYDIIKQNEQSFINLFNISDKTINKLIEYNIELQNSDENNSDLENNSDEINESNSIIIDLDDNNDDNDINDIFDMFQNISKEDIINYYKLFNFNKENLIDFLYENFDI